MIKDFNSLKNYEESKKAVGYVLLKKATQADYVRVGFKGGLEVHQQLNTRKKLFCNCTAKIYNKDDDYDAEIIRHMRPTLSELGEYDGTALMEFKTRKIIVYRIKNETACTYEIDDTPPYPLNREALKIALEISLLCKLNIVGEVHITRKQYLDGSIPTGFQRTAILGVEGEIQLKNKKVRLIQLSIEEDSCREISDIKHIRVYKTDRLGIPLIETVTYPDFINPVELKEGAEYIRFLNRSTGKVRIGIGSGREDVNVSCRGGTRVEIKGVSHNKLIPALSHNEVFRQWALLRIRYILNNRITNCRKWQIHYKFINPTDFDITYEPLLTAHKKKHEIVAINLPDFKGILSHFTQPGKMFANELSDRLKVIACIEKPNIVHSEEIERHISNLSFNKIKEILTAGKMDAQILIWGPKEDIPTALETIEERCKMALNGVPNESRKPCEDGTTLFERVLPGPNRMYPDTDSASIALEDDYLDKLKVGLPEDVYKIYDKLNAWKIPEDTYNYILRNNLFPIIERIINELKIDSRFVGTLFGHVLKNIEGQNGNSSGFSYEKIYDLLNFLKERNVHLNIARDMLHVVYKYPWMEYDSALSIVKFKKISKKAIIGKIPYMRRKFKEINNSKNDATETRWIMGRLRNLAIGNMSLVELKNYVKKSDNLQKDNTLK